MSACRVLLRNPHDVLCDLGSLFILHHDVVDVFDCGVGKSVQLPGNVLLHECDDIAEANDVSHLQISH